MAKKNTPLVNELLSRLGTHPYFETWVKDKKVLQTTIKECRLIENIQTNALKTTNKVLFDI